MRELTSALTRLVGRIEVLLERERAGVADLSHRLRTPITTLRLRVEGLPDGADRERLAADLDELEAMVDHVVREARRSEREGLVAVVRRRGGARPSGRGSGSRWPRSRSRAVHLSPATSPGRCAVRAAEEDLVALVDVLLDNVFTHSPDGTSRSRSRWPRAPGRAGADRRRRGPGFPEGLDVARRGTSGAGSTGLGLSIVDKTATESGGGLSLGASPHGGARVVVELGARASRP